MHTALTCEQYLCAPGHSPRFPRDSSQGNGGRVARDSHGGSKGNGALHGGGEANYERASRQFDASIYLGEDLNAHAIDAHAGHSIFEVAIEYLICARVAKM